MRKLHTKTRIFFKDPIVLIKRYSPTLSLDAADLEHKILCKKLYSQIKSTWGFFPKVSIFSLNGDIKYFYSYFCFSNSEDVLHFKLLTDMSEKVLCWPSGHVYTIHEYSE
jgi:hypothetical protein